MATEPLDRETAIRLGAIRARQACPSEKELLVDALMRALMMTDEGNRDE